MPLEQGDCLLNIPHFEDIYFEYLTKTGKGGEEKVDGGGGAEEELETGYNYHDVVVLTQSCDLENRKVDSVLVAPYIPFEEFLKNEKETTQKEGKQTYYGSQSGKRNLWKNYEPPYLLLNACDLPDFKLPIQIIDFKKAFSVPLAFIEEMAKRQGKRLRLRSPYKEHLSQAFARFFMRVALPNDIKH